MLPFRLILCLTDITAVQDYAQNALKSMCFSFGMQRDIETRKRKKRRQEIDAAIEQLVSMGFERSKGKKSQLTYI